MYAIPFGANLIPGPLLVPGVEQVDWSHLAVLCALLLAAAVLSASFYRAGWRRLAVPCATRMRRGGWWVHARRAA